jgi:hypothetical protein
VATSAIHGAPNGLFVVTVIVTVLPASATIGVYVKLNGLELVLIGTTLPAPFSVIVTLVALPPKVFPLMVLATVLHVLPLVLLKVTVGASAQTACVSVSVAESFPGVGSITPVGGATVAVLTKSPVVPASIVALTVITIELPDPASILAVVEILVVPELEPVIVAFPLATADQDTLVNAPGKSSTIVAPTKSDEPLLVTVIV